MAWALLTAFALGGGNRPSSPTAGRCTSRSGDVRRLGGVRALPRADLRAVEADAHGQRRARSARASGRDHPGPHASPIRCVTFTKDQIAFVYGSKWKQRYFTKVGDDYFPLRAQWDVTHEQWRPYIVADGNRLVGAVLSRRRTASGRPARLCDGCHSVNYNVKTKSRHRVERRLREVPRSRQRRTSARPSRATHRQPVAARSDQRGRRLHPVPLAGTAAGQPGRGPLLRLAGRLPRRAEPEGLLAARGAQARARRRSRTSPTARRTRTGCRGTTSCRA